MQANIIVPPFPMLNADVIPIPKGSSRYSLSYLIIRILRAIMPRGWFCWISRATNQLQSVLRPQKWAYWSKISDQIYLGAMPLKNWGHVEAITDLGVGAILSINEEYEFQNQLFAKPVQASEWKERNVKFLRIASPDLEPMNITNLVKAVDFVVKQANLGKPVYIHCVGGRGRSVSVAIASLVKLQNFTLGQSIRHVCQCRAQAMLSQEQVDALVSWSLAFPLLYANNSL